MRVRVFIDSQALADAAADEVEGWLRLPGGGSTVGLAGGRTPRATYELLRSRKIPWEEVHGWMTDERHVPSDHPDNNGAMVRRALFDHGPATLHEVPWDEDAEVAAAAYEDELATVLTRGPNGLQPGLVILGIGADGHTASLFPESSALEEDERDFVATRTADHGWRLTATFGLLGRARRTLFLVSGEEKAEVVADIFAGDSDLPGALVARNARDPVWLMDRAAASLLDQPDLST